MIFSSLQFSITSHQALQNAISSVFVHGSYVFSFRRWFEEETIVCIEMRRMKISGLNLCIKWCNKLGIYSVLLFKFYFICNTKRKVAVFFFLLFSPTTFFEQAKIFENCLWRPRPRPWRPTSSESVDRAMVGSLTKPVMNGDDV